MATSTRLLPDLDDELVFALGQIDELFLTLAIMEEEDPDEPAQLPAPLAGGVARDALCRLWDAIVPTQSRHDHPAVPGRLLGPDGRYEHRPLRLVAIDDTDLQLLGADAQTLGHALATAPSGELAEAVSAGAEAARPHRRLGAHPGRARRADGARARRARPRPTPPTPPCCATGSPPPAPAPTSCSPRPRKPPTSAASTGSTTCGPPAAASTASLLNPPRPS